MGTIASIIAFLGAYIFGSYSTVAGIIGLAYGLAIFITYLVAVYHNNGILKSISISYYYCNPKWLFQMFMWGAIASILCIGQTWWALVVAILFGIMTCNPTVNGGNVYFIPHMIGAISAIVIANLCTGIYFGLWVIPALVAFLDIFVVITTLNRNIEEHPKYNKENRLYWIEVISISGMILGMAIGGLLI